MIKYSDYEEYFNELNVNECEANALIGYLTVLAEIGINNFNLNGFDDEELCYMDKGVNKTPRG